MDACRSIGPLVILLLSAAAIADETPPPAYTLEYQFKPGQVLNYQTRQSSQIKLNVQGQTFTSSTDLQMVKRWRVLESSGTPGAQIEVTNLEIQMQGSDGTKTFDVDSRDPQKHPKEFEGLLAVVGKPLGVASVSPTGTVLHVKRLIDAEDMAAGLGNLCLPLPEKPVTVGEPWKREFTLTVTPADGERKIFTVLQKYTLETVEGPIATIVYNSVLKTPVNDPQIEVQLAQQLPSGTFEFNRQQGVVVSHTQKLEKNVVGYAGQGTAIDLAITFTEQLQPPPTAKVQPETR